MGACAVLCSLTANALSVGMLRTQYLENPVGIDVAAPAFCWQIESDVRSTLQQSYRIEMATDKGMSAIVYDSGIVESAESAGVTLEGLNLQPSTRYYWRVTVTDNHGSTAVSDGKAFFETGLMDSGWGGAEWIKAASPKGAASRINVISAMRHRWCLPMEAQTAISCGQSILTTVITHWCGAMSIPAARIRSFPTHESTLSQKNSFSATKGASV